MDNTQIYQPQQECRKVHFNPMMNCGNKLMQESTKYISISSNTKYILVAATAVAAQNVQ